MAGFKMPKFESQPRPRVPRVERVPVGRSKTATGGDVSKSGRVRETEGQDWRRGSTR